jgi:hypothetical protein
VDYLSGKRPQVREYYMWRVAFGFSTGREGTLGIASRLHLYLTRSRILRKSRILKAYLRPPLRRIKRVYQFWDTCMHNHHVFRGGQPPPLMTASGAVTNIL